ncbi:dnaJ homolog subfamily C member 9-like [Ylistrum balloti]|uniref:dnaJ homolog subfamily C member 9-like n=1 Tax=Ylistrum balloti TaxID=509963 RepID=UPI002905F105|nr:dnaJ homolog subfamily C member 9-like [Ylistrum balloti]
MPGLLESCRNCFGTDDLYKVIGVQKTATAAEVKRGYHRLSLKVHPDRVEEEIKEEATHKFQTVGKVYSILSDKDKRTVYDETGEVDDEDSLQEDKDWVDYWRILFPKITEEDIKNFEAKYKGSEEERADLKEVYTTFEGDMDEIMEHIMCSSIEDEPRFRKIIKDLIKKGEVPNFEAFSKENKKKSASRKRKAQAEAKEAEEAKKSLGIGANDSLQALILSKQKGRAAQADDFFANLEAKYAQPKKAKGKKK